MSDGQIRVQIVEDLRYTNLRGSVADRLFRARVEAHLGQAIPVEPNCFTEGRHRIYWLGPDEWQVVSAASQDADIASGLREQLSDLHVAVNDLSGGQTTFRVSGGDVTGLLAKGCTLDFHRELLAPGKCAQSGLAKTNVLIGCLEPDVCYDVTVRRSFADYLRQWFEVAARNNGIEFH